MNTTTKPGVLAVFDTEIQHYEECGVVRGLAPFEQKRQNNLREARATVERLFDAASKAQDTNHDDYALNRPDVSHLPEAERTAFLRGWDAASEAVYYTGLRAALAAFRGEQS